jgi:hypothetical protein
VYVFIQHTAECGKPDNRRGDTNVTPAFQKADEARVSQIVYNQRNNKDETYICHKETVCRCYFKAGKNTKQGTIIQIFAYNVHRLTNLVIL